MLINIKEMYLGEIAEVFFVDSSNVSSRRLKEMGLREGKLIEMLHIDHTVTKKILINVDNYKLAFDVALSDSIQVRPLKSYFEVVKNMANYDALTGCFNRHSIQAILSREHEKFMSNEIPLSLLLADIDYFKRINDTHGHSVGDDVLRRISTLFKQVLRRSDCLCRWGGEEFLILLRGTVINDAIQIAERLRQSVESSYFQPIREIGLVTVSIGGSGMPPAGDIEHTIRTADNALYKAKRNGRNRVHFCPVLL